MLVANLIEVEQLAESLFTKKEKNLRILNCTHYVPSERKNPLEEHMNGRIPTAQFFDIAYIAEKGTPNPLLIPTKIYEKVTGNTNAD